MDRRLKQRRLTSILSYWTVRYVLILCAGLTVIAVCSLYWIRETATDNRLKTAGMLGQEIADRVLSPDGRLSIPPQMDKLLHNRLGYFNFKGDLCLVITDAEGKIAFSMPPINDYELRKRMTPDLQQPTDSGTKAVIVPVASGENQVGQVTLMMSRRSLGASPNELALVVVMLVTLMLSGWLTIYLLSRKLAFPIRRVAEGARLIREGQYDVSLDVETKEREIQELVDSFKDMASRLRQLEDWRALSLAGVTHELKTPVTSIKGLLMAVREEVVTEEEAKEFLDVALRESGRLERMVADLLDYNALEAGGVEIAAQPLELRTLVSEIVYQWELTNVSPGSVEGPESRERLVFLSLPQEPIHAWGDALRIQQIIVNLLNNARQAAIPGRELQITVTVSGNVPNGAPSHAGDVVSSTTPGFARVEVADNGGGMSPEEQPHIFERFYRGESKKLRTRGLGLGLTYSRLMAEAQGGELSLTSSSPEGSVFALELPIGSAGASRIRSNRTLGT